MAHIELARTIYIYGVYTVFLAGISPNIRSNTVYIYGSGQPYTYKIHISFIKKMTEWKG